MLLGYIRKRWFTIALLLIVLIAIARKNLRFQAGDTAAPPREEPREKYTDDVAPAKSASLLNLGSDGAGPRVLLPEIDDATSMAFLKRFAQVAVAEQKKFGMPASVLLGCAYINSFAGRRDCAIQANNYLAVRCSPDWTGPVSSCSGACFRQYETAWESIRDFNVHFSRKDWYVALRKSAGQDWKQWARVLADHRVSDVEDFSEKLPDVIREYRLYELDSPD